MYTRFRARKTVLGASLSKLKIVHVKQQPCTLLIITWYGGRNCTKLVLKPLEAKNRFSTSVLCTVPFLWLHCFSLHDDYPPFVYTTRYIYRTAPPFLINWNEKRCSKSNILTMDRESWTCFWKFQFSCCLHFAHYLFKGSKVFEDQTEIDLLKEPWTCERLRIECCTMAVRIRDYCIGNLKHCGRGCFYFLKA